MRTRITLTICLCLLLAGRASAQWAVIDPSNIAQSIVNTSKNVVHTSTTATNMVKNFQETVKIYEQGKKYYDGAEIGEQPRQGRTQGAADHTDGGRHHGHLRDQFPTDDARRQLHGGGTRSHRLRLHEAVRGIQRRADGAEERGEHHHALHDGQGAHGRGGTLPLQDEALPQPRELLHQQEHQRELPACEEEKRPRPHHGAVRQYERKILVAYGVRQPSPDSALAL